MASSFRVTKDSITTFSPAVGGEGCKKSNQYRAFTLVELLVVIAIIAILVSLLTGAVVRAKVSGYQSQDLNVLRQLSIAQSLYEQDYGDRALGAAPLVSAGLIPSNILKSPLDPNPQGLVNATLQELYTVTKGNTLYSSRETSYPNSFFGWRDYGKGHQSYNKCLSQGTGRGWIVDIDYPRSLPNTSDLKIDPLIGVQHYVRLEDDGSAQPKDEVYYGDCNYDKNMHCGYSTYSLFADYPPDMMPTLMNTDYCNIQPDN